ncbi:MAG: hypothetical protein ACR2MO_14025 [Acidimicrobiales bacterium]
MTRRPLVLAIALMTGVVVATAFVVSRDDGDGSGSRVEVATGGPPAPRVPATVPAGLDAAAAITLPMPGDDRPPSSVRIFGSPGADDPFAAGDLAVFVTTVPAGADHLPEGEKVTVRGKDGVLRRDYGQDRAVLVVSWPERDGQYVRAASRHYTLDDLLAAAAALTITADGEVTTGPLPGGVEPVASQDDATVPGATSVPVGLATPGHVASYTSPDNGPDVQRHLAVGSFAGAASDLLVLEWWFGPTMARTTVGGQPAVRATLSASSCTAAGAGTTCSDDGPGDPDRTTYILAWVDDDGVVVTMSAKGITEAELTASAAGVRPATTEEWAALTAAADAREAARQSRSTGSSGSSAGTATTVLTSRP